MFYLHCIGSWKTILRVGHATADQHDRMYYCLTGGPREAGNISPTGGPRDTVLLGSS